METQTVLDIEAREKARIDHHRRVEEERKSRILAGHGRSRAVSVLILLFVISKIEGKYIYIVFVLSLYWRFFFPLLLSFYG